MGTVWFAIGVVERDRSSGGPGDLVAGQARVQLGEGWLVTN